MKKSIVFLIIIIFLIIFGLINKTFFSEKYIVLNEVNNVVYLPIPKFSFFLNEENNEIKLYTLEKEDTINKFINNYLKDLESCYDNKYYYDFNRHISIKNYSYDNNIINIKYVSDNICIKEHELSSNWSNKFNDAEYKYIKYNNIDIEESKFKEFINSFSNYEFHRYNEDIKMDNKYYLVTEFTYRNKSYKTEITYMKKNFIGIKISYDDKFEVAKFETKVDNILEEYF